MKNTKNLLLAAAVSGALAAIPMVAYAEALTPVAGPTAEKMGCNGKSGQPADKASCQGMDKQGKDSKKDKHGCSGKEGCGGKDKQK
jgi:hypothetical protein